MKKTESRRSKKYLTLFLRLHLATTGNALVWFRTCWIEEKSEMPWRLPTPPKIFLSKNMIVSCVQAVIKTKLHHISHSMSLNSKKVQPNYFNEAQNNLTQANTRCTMQHWCKPIMQRSPCQVLSITCCVSHNTPFASCHYFLPVYQTGCTLNAVWFVLNVSYCRPTVGPHNA